MSAMQRLYSVQEAAADPFAIPDSPFRFVEIRDRFDTYVVLAGSVRIGTVRHDAGSGLFVAKTTGCPNGSAPADIHRNFATRDKAAEWLSRAIDGVQPRRRHGGKRKALIAAAAVLGLAMGDPALAGDGYPPVPWVSPPPMLPPRPSAIGFIPQHPQSAPPADLLNAVVALRVSCPLWRNGDGDGAAGFESEAHICAVLAGHDPAYTNGAIAGSLLATAVLGGIWLLSRLPAWLGSILAPVRRRRNYVVCPGRRQYLTTGAGQ
jgi:hypothetical protein